MRRDALLYVLEAINRHGAPGKKVMQKLVYLLQRRGIDFQFTFQMHFYGPYSSALDYALQSFERQGVITIEQRGPSSLLKISPYTWEEVDRNCLEEELCQYLTIIDDVLAEFAGKTPRELELLTTVDFVYEELVKRDSAVTPKGVCHIVSNLKGSKFDGADISEAVAKVYSCTNSKI